ncbi:MAG: dynamin family protein [Kangiellaceae bacterium]|jgi:dynamin family protein
MTNNFSENIDQFSAWKADIGKTISKFRMWLRRNDLFNDEIDNRLFRLQDSLREEYLTIGFVGEFSRGKTELINALFFAEYGQRILPSEAGRTTMCPTELFYDKKENRPYLRLLPIETRLDHTTLTEFRDLPNLWTEVPLMTSSAHEMTLALHTITQTKQVSIEEAKLLGFDPEVLEKNGDEDNMVEIPAWRHAIVSFPHPLLKQGLRILDTPGLNALGSEPELTLKLLPQVQAIVFLLSADTGVTASDMAIWEDYIQNIDGGKDLGLFAVLNKIDTLWDELTSRKKIDKAVTKMVNTTARQLQIDPRNVLPVSAQKGLVAKVRKDKPLLVRSHLEELEHVLSNKLLENKERLLTGSLLEEIKTLIHQSLQVLNNKHDQLTSQEKELKSLTGVNKDKIHELIENNRVAMIEFQKKSLSVKPSQRLLERQTKILLSVVSSDALATEVETTLDELVNSKTTIGLFRQMKLFFVAIKTIMTELSREAELTNKMAASLYKKFSKDFNVELFEPKPFPIVRLNRELNEIIRRSDKLDKNVFTTFTEHSVAVKRFFSGTVTDVMNFFKNSRKEMIDWSQSIINPLNQQLRIHHHMIITHRTELDSLRKSESNIVGKLKAVNTLLGDLENERQKALELSHSLENSKLIDEDLDQPDNIVPLSAASRRKY